MDKADQCAITRRAAMLSAVASITASGVTVASGVAASAPADPIFDLIERHRQAEAAFNDPSVMTASDTFMVRRRGASNRAFRFDADEAKAIDAAYDAIAEAADDAVWKLVEAPPATTAGALALLRYVKEFAASCPWPEWEHELFAVVAQHGVI